MKKFITLITLAALVISVSGCGKKNQKDEKETAKKETTVVEETTTEATQEVEQSGDFTVEFKKNNEWDSNGKKCAQYDGVIKNNTSSPAANWEISVIVPEDSKIQNGWNGEFDIDGELMVITPVSYNYEIPANGQVDIGCIMETKESYTPEIVVLKINEKTYSMKGTDDKK